MLRPRLRPGVGAGVDEDGRLRLLFYAESRHVVYDAHPAVLETIRLLDEPQSFDGLLAQVCSTEPAFTAADLAEILATLEEEGALDDAAAADGLLDADACERFERQIGLFHDLAEGATHPVRAQHALRRAQAAVIGVGGTGTWMAQTLAMAGVGRLLLVDADVVARSNLSRQALFSADDVGRPKIEAAAARLRAVAGPGLSVRTVSARLDENTDLGALVDGCDLVVNCADEPDTNTTAALVARACLPLRIPHIVGGAYAGHVGLIGPTILPYRSACWTCFAREAEERNKADRVTPLLRHRARHTGAFAPLSALVANLQAWDALRVLSGIAPPALTDRLGELDLRTCELRWRTVPRDPACPDCSEEPTVPAVTTTLGEV
jgi:bacteriocin biosynthesis cyclodehydratase domain-containing protein